MQHTFVCKLWYPRPDLNWHAYSARDFKSLVSTDSTTRAKVSLICLLFIVYQTNQQNCGGATRSRTEIDGFAIRSIAILPSRHAFQIYRRG
jgi:hypothetical protein